MGILDTIRMMSLFNPSGFNPDSQFGPTPQAPPMFNVPSMPPPMEQMNIPIQGMEQQFQMPEMETEASDRFNQMLNQMPQRQNPGMLQKIVASMTGAAQGPKAALDLLNQPYNQQVEDWKMRIAPVQQAAQLERLTNVNTRTAAQQTEAARLNREKVENKEKTDNERNALLRLKTEHPNMKFDFSGPTVLVADPNTGEIKDSKVPTGNLNDTDKITLTTSGKDLLQTKKGDIDAGLIGLRQEGNERVAKINVQGRSDVVDKRADVKEEEEKRKKDAAYEVVKNGANETISALDELLVDSKLRPEVAAAVGKSRMLGLQHIPTTQTRAGDKMISRLKNMLVIDLIGEMKSQSRTGATGFGALNLKELGVLEKAANKLDEYGDEEVFLKELMRIRERLNKIIQTGKLSAAELRKKYGG